MSIVDRPVGEDGLNSASGAVGSASIFEEDGVARRREKSLGGWMRHHNLQQTLSKKRYWTVTKCDRR